MVNRYVSWVSDEHFLSCVKYVCDAYSNPKLFSDTQFHKNTIDPIKLIFDLSNMHLSMKDWVSSERIRQAGKTVNNCIGEFHQKLLGGVEGWKDLGVGDESKVDLMKQDKTVFIELKNKHNTTNSSSLDAVRRKLEVLSSVNPHAVFYWAFIVSKNGDSGECIWNLKGYKSKPNMRKIWGANVYSLVTRKKTALQELWAALPIALQDITTETLNSNELKKLQEFFERAFS